MAFNSIPRVFRTRKEIANEMAGAMTNQIFGGPVGGATGIHGPYAPYPSKLVTYTYVVYYTSKIPGGHAKRIEKIHHADCANGYLHLYGLNGREIVFAPGTWAYYENCGEDNGDERS